MAHNKRNVEGLTFDEWLAAVPSWIESDQSKLCQAWLAGEDPTEHEAAYQNERAARLQALRGKP